MQKTDPFAEAIEDVQSVAAELKQLQQRTQEYKGAAERLQIVGSQLEKTVVALSGVRNALDQFRDEARTIQADIASNRSTMEKLVDAVPDIIARIEAAEVSQSVEEMSATLKDAKDHIASHRMTMEASITETRSFSLSQRTEDQFRHIADQLLASDKRLMEMQSSIKAIHDDQVSNTRLLTTLAQQILEIRQTTDRSNEATAQLMTKVLQEVNGLNTGLALALKGIDHNVEALEAMKKKKKRFLFF